MAYLPSVEHHIDVMVASVRRKLSAEPRADILARRKGGPDAIDCRVGGRFVLSLPGDHHSSRATRNATRSIVHPVQECAIEIRLGYRAKVSRYDLGNIVACLVDDQSHGCTSITPRGSLSRLARSCRDGKQGGKQGVIPSPSSSAMRANRCCASSAIRMRRHSRAGRGHKALPATAYAAWVAAQERRRRRQAEARKAAGLGLAPHVESGCDGDHGG